MRVDLVVLCVAAVTLSLPALSTCDPLYVMSAPNLLRVGSPERVFVEAQDYMLQDSIKVSIIVNKFPEVNTNIKEITVHLTPENSFQEITEFTIPPRDYIGAVEPQYVQLKAIFQSKAISQTLDKVVLLSFQSGYIYLQTDKTIYTPSSTVYYRVFALSPDFKPTQASVQVDILSENGILMKNSETISPVKGMISGTYSIPELVSVGTWSLVARFSQTPQKNFTAEFEVKEYVLPSFEIVLSPRKSFFHVDDLKLEIDITAQYLYGKEVTGMAFVMFGVISGNDKRSLPHSLKKEEIRNGKGVVTLERKHITQVFPNINDVVESSIYVHVNVLTHTGSEMVEAEKRGIKIVSSPYSIQFWKTPKYFKPSMPFDVMLYVSNPDGSPAVGIKVAVTTGDQRVEMETPTNGIARFTFNTQDKATPLPITAIINDKQEQMVVSPYQPKPGSQNYLHIQVSAGQQSIGDQLGFTLNPRISTSEKELDFTYLILSRGQIVEAKRLKWRGNSVLHVNLKVTNAMVPSFRIVTYYHVGSEVVSDSVWVDVDDTCMGKLEIKADVKNTQFQPKGRVTLQISGDPSARVGLLAVDKGVYVLNNKHRLTQKKIWDTVEKLDIACTAGSGKNSMGVFYDAGLVFETNTAGGTDSREDSTCVTKAKRRRRAVTIMEVQTTAAKNYTGEERQCCVDGMKKNILGYSCQRRSEFILDGPECKAAFLKCCDIMSNHREEEKEEYLQLARSDLSEEQDMDEFIKDLTSRSIFPESWLWIEQTLPTCSTESCTEMPRLSIEKYFPDTITSWQFTAISLSDTKGICVAETLSLAVHREFFIDLKLPYSAVRHEQIEIRAILHNNREESLKVRVELYNTDGICSDATKSGNYRTTVVVAEKSTYAVPFVIVPMGEPKKYTIEVKAMVYGSFFGDGVKKDLLVVTEGVLVRKPERFELDPAMYGGEQTRSLLPYVAENRIPGSEAKTFITLQGDDLGITIEKAISGEAMKTLIRQPGGCGEQNMFGITMPVTAANYLDKTNQWHKVGVSRRQEAVNFIQSGYNNQLKYRKEDGSYGAWDTTPSSTWLTAYVAKVFSMASNIISIEEKVLCSAIQWLILNRKLPDGRFTENAPVIYIKAATGDVSGEDSDVSMTAFVLIAMQESMRICYKVNNLQASINQAIRYLESRIGHLKNPYAVAMASYAMATAGKLNKSIFYKFSSADDTHWPVPRSHLFTLEATAYALLTLVKMREFERAGPVVSWLNKQQIVGYGKSSTQPTIMVFQAIAEYREQAKTAPAKDLHVTIGSTITRTTPITLSFTQDEAFRPRTEKFELNEKITIKATGKGKGTLFMERLYYAEPKEENMVCNLFHLDVKLKRQVKVQYPQAKESYLLTIDVKFLSSTVDAGMSILDISILTGFVVDETDLHELLEGKDRYIQNFEKDKKLSDRGSLIIYLNKISHQQTDTIAFKVHKVMDVGLLQPAAVTVYEYYNTENRCVKFYHTQKQKGELTRLCDKKTNICQCAEEMCCKQKTTTDEFAKRASTACEGRTDYVIKATLLEMNGSSTTDYYHFKVKNIKLGTDDKMIDGSERVFMAHATCRETLDLHKNKSYLIMGAKQDIHIITDGYQIVLGEQTWVEYWPTQAEKEHVERYVELSKLAYELDQFGCGY